MFELRVKEIEYDISRYDVPKGPQGFRARHGSPSRQKIRSNLSDAGISLNALVRTARGQIPARELRIGDQMVTRDNGLQTLRWIGQSRPRPEQGPLVRVLGADKSQTQVLLAPGNLVLLTNDRANLLFGSSEVLCPVQSLFASSQFEREVSATPTLCHLLFDHCELIEIGGVWVESHCPDMPRIRHTDPELFDEIVRVMPRLAHDTAIANYIRNHIVLNDHEVTCLFT
ncbi:Hint domain-containing protein [Aliiroseovarius sp. KMU-50]|uniref:Hint domain-containing protein n=1 Tax=Aliiroseovarius salicola TaxID=3009082 RepID=A0ABT4W324_9RHOB|nr:Hint domain-containing protein [Aliiroseovarius sp. KMU-50]MDA5094917.1 Hint domain-containing protein [Aliiroseovarius sp. KMU-50]